MKERKHKNDSPFHNFKKDFFPLIYEEELFKKNNIEKIAEYLFEKALAEQRAKTKKN